MDKYRSNATLIVIWLLLSIAISIASKEWGWLEENPMIKVKKKREARGRVRFLSDKEKETLLSAYTESTNPHLYPVVVIALTTGARMLEILNLKWENVFLDTKNGESRSAHIAIPVLELLKKRSKVRNIKTNYVFPRNDGKNLLTYATSGKQLLKKQKLKILDFTI